MSRFYAVALPRHDDDMPLTDSVRWFSAKAKAAAWAKAWAKRQDEFVGFCDDSVAVFAFDLTLTGRAALLWALNCNLALGAEVVRYEIVTGQEVTP